MLGSIRRTRSSTFAKRLLSWNDDPAYDHHEIDLEFSRWGTATNLNAQDVIHTLYSAMQ